MSLHSTCLPVAHEDEDFYLFTYLNSCTRPVAMEFVKDYVCLWNDL